MADRLTVLIVSADEAYLSELATNLGGPDGFDVRVATSVDEAIASFVADPTDCLISDYDLPDSDGVRLLQIVRTRDATVPFVLFTDHGDERIASDAMAADVTDYLIKERFDDQWNRLGRLVSDAVGYRRERDAVTGTEWRGDAVLNAIPDAVVVVQDGRIEFINRSGADLLGGNDRFDDDSLDHEAVGDGEPQAPTAPELVDVPYEQWIRLREPTVLDGIVSAVRDDDRTFIQRDVDVFSPGSGYVPARLSLARTEWDGRDALVFVIADDSDRRTVERDLAVKNRAIDGAPIGITLVDADAPDLPLVYVNDEFLELTGYDESEVLGRNCRFLQDDDTDPEAVAAIREAIETEEPVTVDLLNYRKDGTEFWNRLTVAPVRTADDEVTHFVGFQVDVTEQVEATRALRRFKQAVEAAGQAIFTTDTEGRITYANPAFEAVTGYDPATLTDGTQRVFGSGRHDDEYYERLRETITSGETWRDEVVDERKSGETYYALRTISPVSNDDGDIEEFVVIQVDITPRREQERHIATLDRVLRHDLRNRLNIVAGRADELRDDASMEAVEAHAQAVFDVVDELLAIADRGRDINQLLMRDPEHGVFEIVPVVRTAVAEAQRAHESARIDLDVACSTDAEALATENVGEAISGLIEYLIERVEHDRPTVDVRVTENDEGCVEVRISDDEAPIPEMEHGVFEEDRAVDDLYHGTGLDLWFVYWVVRRSKATLSFGSGESRGNAVTITFRG